MITLIQAQIDPSVAKWYSGITLIMFIGAAAILLLVIWFACRRWARRQIKAIEQDKTARRAASSADRVDAWREGANRYVDQDKLHDEPPYGYEPDEENQADDPDEDGPIGGGFGGPEHDDAEEEQDPFGLFDDKPYRDPEDEEDDEDDDTFDEDDDDDFETDIDDTRR